jgi:hypothetical protein
MCHHRAIIPGNVPKTPLKLQLGTSLELGGSENKSFLVIKNKLSFKTQNAAIDHCFAQSHTSIIN